MSLIESFFSDINKEHVYDLIKDIVMNNFEINISLDDEYKKIYMENMKDIYDNSDITIYNLDQLNNNLMSSTIKLYKTKLDQAPNINDNKDINAELEKINNLRNNDDISFKNIEYNEENNHNILNEKEIPTENIKSYKENTKFTSLDLNNDNDNSLEKIEPEKSIVIPDKKESIKKKKTIQISSNNRSNNKSSRFNYMINTKSNNIKFNNNKIEQLIIPIENNYIFSLPILKLKINELSLNITMKLDEIIDNNHRKYGTYYPIENHNIKSINDDNITINITDITETIHNKLDTLFIIKIEINSNDIILYNKYMINDILVNDFLKLIDIQLIDIQDNQSELEKIFYEPMKVNKINHNKIFIENKDNLNDISIDINMNLMNISNQNIIFIK